MVARRYRISSPPEPPVRNLLGFVFSENDPEMRLFTQEQMEYFHKWLFRWKDPRHLTREETTSEGLEPSRHRKFLPTNDAAVRCRGRVAIASAPRNFTELAGRPLIRLHDPEAEWRFLRVCVLASRPMGWVHGSTESGIGSTRIAGEQLGDDGLWDAAC